MNLLKTAAFGTTRVDKKAKKNVEMYRDILMDIDRMPPNVKSFIKKQKDDIIQKVSIGRSKIPSGIQKILKTVGGSIPYDNIYHLFVIIYTEKTHFILEKNERLNIAKTIPKNIEERIEVPNLKDISVIEMFDNTRKQMGSLFLPYDANNNNCQNFVLNLMTSNGQNGFEKFIKQDTEGLFKEHGKLLTVANSTVGIGKVVNILSQGGQLNNKKTNLKYNSNNMNINLSTAQIRKMKKNQGFQLSHKQLTSDIPNYDVSNLPDKQQKAIKKAIRLNKGVRFTPDVVGWNMFVL